jgi:hypothetical protein
MEMPGRNKDSLDAPKNQIALINVVQGVEAAMF